MPFIEELANPTAHTAAPGWAYVPDTGYDPSKAAIVPSGARKRQARAGHSSAAATAAASARQQNRISKRLATLEKENHRDIAIPIPSRSKDAGSRGLQAKMTTGVKRILASEKNLAHHLADEEAAIANNQYHPIEQIPRSRPRALLKGRDALQHGSKKTSKNPPSTSIPKDPDAMEGIQPENLMDMGQEIGTQPSLNEVYDDNLVLQSNIPNLPSEEEIEALLSAPPLPYAQAQAAPSTSTAPPRQFCEMCGYWGRVRCTKCGLRICGLDCKIQHDETNCMKFYA